MKNLVLICMLFCSLAVAGQTEQNRLALVIGNANYQFAGELKSSEYDAEAIAKSLQNLNFKVMKGINCKKHKLDSLINQFLSDLEYFEVGLIYYSGHGINLEGKNYIVPTDVNLTSKEQIDFELISLDSLLNNMAQAKLKFNIIITDAYRANRFGNIKDIHYGFGAFGEKKNFGIVYAAIPGSVACDCFGIEGLFAQILLKHINKPELEITDLFKTVRKEVYEYSNQKQLTSDRINFDGSFYFKK